MRLKARPVEPLTDAFVKLNGDSWTWMLYARKNTFQYVQARRRFTLLLLWIAAKVELARSAELQESHLMKLAAWIPRGSWKDVTIGNYDYKYLFMVCIASFLDCQFADKPLLNCLGIHGVTCRSPKRSCNTILWQTGCRELQNATPSWTTQKWLRYWILESLIGHNFFCCSLVGPIAAARQLRERRRSLQSMSHFLWSASAAGIIVFRTCANHLRIPVCKSNVCSPSVHDWF